MLLQLLHYRFLFPYLNIGMCLMSFCLIMGTKGQHAFVLHLQTSGPPAGGAAIMLMKPNFLGGDPEVGVDPTACS